jgi:hypothetical protein
MKRIFEDKLKFAKPEHVDSDEKTLLAACNSRAVGLAEMKIYCMRRLRTLDDSLSFYGQARWREQRRDAHIRRQQSEELHVFKKFEEIRRQNPEKLMVIAYGSWGMKAGRMRLKGLPPTIGVGLLRKLARRFVVCVTPERNTSTTCSICGGDAVSCEKVNVERNVTDVRGLRQCVRCGVHLNRDRNGACNIRRVFMNAYNDCAPLAFQDDQIEDEIADLNFEVME